MEAPGGAQRRRSPRILWRTSILVNWLGDGGLTVREQAETEIVNAHGALLRLPAALERGQAVELLHPTSNESQNARVVWTQESAGGWVSAGVELKEPSATFWGINIPIRGSHL